MSGSAALARPRAHPTPPAARPTPRAARLRRAALHSIGFVVLLLAWEIASRFALIRPFLLPPLPAVLARLGTDLVSGAFALNAALTLYRTLAGFALASLVGIPLGILISRRRLVGWFVEPIVSVGFPMPTIAFLPIFMLWFGVFDLSKIIMTGFSAVFTVIAAADAGTRGVERHLVWSAESLGARRGDVFFEVMLPAAMPQIATGLQVALPLALIVEVASEMLMGGAGLGGMMVQATSYADSVGVYAGIVETAAVGAVAVGLMARLRRRLLRWHPESVAA
jgi:ABC-type nitrate/sulfonate/bicarbonate transport system permease component